MCPVNGYYNVAINFGMADMANVRRIVVMGYTLGGATGVQSNYLEALDMTFEDHTNQNYSQPWYFTAGTTVAVGMGGRRWKYIQSVCATFCLLNYCGINN